MVTDAIVKPIEAQNPLSHTTLPLFRLGTRLRESIKLFSTTYRKREEVLEGALAF